MSRPHPDSQPETARARIGRDVVARLAALPLIRATPFDTVQICYQPNFLTRSQCRQLIRIIDTDAFPSKVLGDDDAGKFRTSHTYDFRAGQPELAALDRKLDDATGQPFARGERPQGQRYEPGQYFRPHHDYFDETGSYWPRMQAQGGQRTWTAMIYLNDVEQGGETLFPRIGFKVAPLAGFLLVWNNLRADGSPNPDTIHEGCPVIAGTKYIVTKWYREADWIDRGAPLSP